MKKEDLKDLKEEFYFLREYTAGEVLLNLLINLDCEYMDDLLEGRQVEEMRGGLKTLAKIFDLIKKDN